jgi:hypothetical protein
VAQIHITDRTVYRFLAVLVFAAGVCGMGMSFLFLGSNGNAENIAGLAGFVAGSILVGSGLIALALLADPRRPGPGPVHDIDD